MYKIHHTCYKPGVCLGGKLSLFSDISQKSKRRKLLTKFKMKFNKRKTDSLQNTIIENHSPQNSIREKQTLHKIQREKWTLHKTL